MYDNGTLKPRIKRLNKLAWLLDNSIRIPWINYRIGLDPLLGLIPGFGEAVGALLSMYIVSEAAMARLPSPVLARMGFNIALEVIVGSIPIVGDIFDMTWKANARNARLIEQYAASAQKTVTSSKVIIIIISIIFLFLVLASIYMGFLILRQIWRMID